MEKRIQVGVNIAICITVVLCVVCIVKIRIIYNQIDQIDYLMQLNIANDYTNYRIVYDNIEDIRDAWAEKKRNMNILLKNNIEFMPWEMWRFHIPPK